jgi:hypothetical protein
MLGFCAHCEHGAVRVSVAPEEKYHRTGSKSAGFHPNRLTRTPWSDAARAPGGSARFKQLAAAERASFRALPHPRADQVAILLIDSKKVRQVSCAIVRLRVNSTADPLNSTISKLDQKWEFKFDLGIRSLVPEWKLAANSSWDSIKRDLFAGITIPTVSIPVSLAAALLSSVPPHWGLISGPYSFYAQL